jgi:hypothetical protein
VQSSPQPSLDPLLARGAAWQAMGCLCLQPTQQATRTARFGSSGAREVHACMSLQMRSPHACAVHQAVGSSSSARPGLVLTLPLRISLPTIIRAALGASPLWLAGAPALLLVARLCEICLVPPGCALVGNCKGGAHHFSWLHGSGQLAVLFQRITHPEALLSMFESEWPWEVCWIVLQTGS